MTPPAHAALASALALSCTLAAASARADTLDQSHARQPVIEVGASERGLSLRSMPLARADFDGLPPTAAPSEAPSDAAAESVRPEGAEAQEKPLGSRWGRALSRSLVPFGLLSGAFVLVDGQHHRGQLRGAAEGVGATLVATAILKRVVPEERPRGGPRSFPSGHASLAFAFATAASYNHRSARLPLFGLATAIAASRVNVRAHHVHDVVAGAALGYFTTRYFMRRNRPSGASVARAFEMPTAASFTSSPEGMSVNAGGLSFARSF